MSGAHTPGPWFATGNSSFDTLVRAHDAKSGRRIADTFASQPSVKKGATTEEVRAAALRQGRTNEANARLIAAAPEMLALLQKLIDRETGAWHLSSLELDCGVWGDELEAEIKALVAKATGATE
jgi:hypothetical protein